MSGNKILDELEIGYGPLGTGLYYFWNAAFSTPNRGSGDKLTGWCLACNQDDDIIFMHTNGYYSGYLRDNPAPGPHRSTFRDNRFKPAGIDVKSRDSDSRFMVLKLSWPDAHCTRDQLVEYARRWGGYEVTGEEKDYYISLIRAAREEQAKRLKAQEEQEEKAREEKRETCKKEKEDRKLLREKYPEEYRKRYPEEWLKEELRKEDPEEYRRRYPKEYRRREYRKEAGLASEDDDDDE